MKRRIFSGIALVLALLLLLSACGDTNPADTEAEQSTEAAPSGLVLFSKEDSYKIIRGDRSGETETAAAVRLRNSVKEVMTNLDTVIIETDFLIDNKKDETVDHPGKEILIGHTNRRESREITETLKANEYVIRAVNDKVVITGGNEYSTDEAMRVFLDMYLPLCNADGWVIDAALDVKGETSREGPELSEGASYRLLSWNLGCAVGVLSDVVTVLEKYMPEIIALQECNPKSHTDAVDKFIARHPEYKFAKRSHDSGTKLYTPIIYNSDVVNLVYANCEWLRSRYTGTNTKSIGWAVFEVDGQQFAMLNFHGAVVSADYDGYQNMSSDERSAIAAEWRLDNVKQLLELKDKIVRNYGDIPITINGDCNFNSTSQCFNNLLNAGFKDAEQTADVKIDYGYKTSYSYKNGVPGKGNSIDHIFGINGIHFVTFDIIREEPVATASDHTPIYADIGFD